MGFVAVLVVGISYVIGTMPSAIWMARWRGHDPRVEGSGNPGASNVFRVAGKAAGSATLAMDVLKGAVPTAIGMLLDGRKLAAACWVAATIGHVFPVNRKLRGGKGVATAGGGTLVLFPPIGFGLLAMFIMVAKVGKKASLGSLMMAFGLIFAVAATGRPNWEIAVTAGLVGIVIVRHWSNILRLIRRQEHGLSEESALRH